MGESSESWPRGSSRLGALACAGLLLTSTARADTVASDGVYGRFDGDIALEPGLGVLYSQRTLLPQLDVAATYLSTVGLRLRHADSKLSFGATDNDRGDTALAFELHPLFLPRWTQSMETGPALLDLAIDSFTLGIGVFWEYDRGTSHLRRGSELTTGLGLPLLATNGGPWLRATAALRLVEGSDFRMGTCAAYTLVFGWNFPINSGLHDDSE
jgi:hypothetical protein